MMVCYGDAIRPAIEVIEVARAPGASEVVEVVHPVGVLGGTILVAAQCECNSFLGTFRYPNEPIVLRVRCEVGSAFNARSHAYIFPYIIYRREHFPNARHSTRNIRGARLCVSQEK